MQKTPSKTNCAKDCRSKCWADYMDDKNSIFGKLIFIYIISLFFLSSFLIKEYNILIIEYFQSKNFYIKIYFIQKFETFRKFIFLYIVINYILCFFKDPGYIPEKISPPKNLEKDIFSKNCKICKKWKPPRAHHCRRCQKCVFKMDHHCYFINNCVGVRNLKIYILFLISLLIYDSIFFFNSIIGSIFIFKHKLYLFFPKFFIFREFLHIFCLLQGCYFFPYIFNLLKKSLESVFYNKTEVEIKKEVKGSKIDKKNAIKKVFGRNKIFYFYPNFPPNLSNYLENCFDESEAECHIDLPEYLIIEKYNVI